MTSNHSTTDASWPRPTERPPGGTAPVSIPINLTLVRRPGLLVRATVASAYQEGFQFGLSICFDIRHIPFEQVDFYAPRDLGHPLPARLLIRFPDGRTADSIIKNPGNRRNEAAILVYTGGLAHPCPADEDDSDGFRQHETSWWVSPLPPPGPLEFQLYLRDSAERAGAETLEGSPIVEAFGPTRGRR